MRRDGPIAMDETDWLELKALLEEMVRRALNEKLGEDLGETCARAINERRRAQGKSDLDL